MLVRVAVMSAVLHLLVSQRAVNNSHAADVALLRLPHAAQATGLAVADVWGGHVMQPFAMSQILFCAH